LGFFFVKEEKLAFFMRGKRRDIFFTIYSLKTQRYNNEAERIPENNPLHVFILGGGGGKRRKRRRPFSREDDDNDSDGFE
jgi:hypothetical protein